MSKYNTLWKYIVSSESPFLELTFSEIEKISGIPIDHSFLKYKKELTEYGWQAAKISMKEQTIVFEKIGKMYEIRKIHSNEVTEALALASEVFMQFEAPEYKPEGVETFKRDIIENAEFISACRQGICPVYPAFDKGKIIGIIGMRSSKTHISLVFVKKEYHRQGIATAIFRYLLSDILKENPTLREITLNSSPYGKPFYLHIGFVPLSEEQETDGIRFTPMKYTIERTT